MRIEQKTLLIYGNMITATLGELASNDSIVRAIRAELLEQEPFDVDFAMLSDSNNKLTLLYLYDIDEEGLGNEFDAISDFSRFLTGDGLPDVKLRYPIFDKENSPEYMTIDAFAQLYKMNNSFYGGDEIDDVELIASPTMLRVNIYFKDAK